MNLPDWHTAENWCIQMIVPIMAFGYTGAFMAVLESSIFQAILLCGVTVIVVSVMPLLAQICHWRGSKSSRGE